MRPTTSKSAEALEPPALLERDAAPPDSNTSASRVPDKPLVVIEPASSWAALDLRGLWVYRELLYFMIWRDVKVRYKQTALGVLWAILQPLFMMLAFTLFFGRVAGVASDGVPYPLFAYVGLVPWTFFSNAANTSGNSLVTNAHLITKVYFPRLIVPAAAVGAGLVDFVLAFVPLVGMLIYYGVGPTRHLLALPGLIVMTALFALAVGTWLAALNAKYRDVRFALPFVIQLWLFVSSVIVPSSAVPAGWRWLLVLNPMSAIVEGYRSTLLGLPFDWPALSVAAVITLAALVYAAYSFRRAERQFADII